jgi:hypothetical protein
VAEPPRPGSPGARGLNAPPASAPAAHPIIPPVPPGPRPQYYPGTIPVPMAISGPPPLPTYPPGFGPPRAPVPGMPPPGYAPRGPIPFWSPPPYGPPSPAPTAVDPLLELNQRLAEMEAAQVAEARRLGALELAGRNSTPSPFWLRQKLSAKVWYQAPRSKGASRAFCPSYLNFWTLHSPPRFNNPSPTWHCSVRASSGFAI